MVGSGRLVGGVLEGLADGQGFAQVVFTNEYLVAAATLAQPRGGKLVAVDYAFL
jgi:hypothetical protein